METSSRQVKGRSTHTASAAQEAVQCKTHAELCGALQQGCVCKGGVKMQNAVLGTEIVLVMLQLLTLVCLTA